MIRDQALIQILETKPMATFSGVVTRIHWQSRGPLQGGTAGGRWSLPGGVETLYTSLCADTAVAEIGHRLKQAGHPLPTAALELASIRVSCAKVLDLRSAGVLGELGLDQFASDDFSVSAAVGDAAYYLGCDGILVPSARSDGDGNLVIFIARADISAFQVLDSATLTPQDIVDRFEAFGTSQRLQSIPQAANG